MQESGPVRRGDTIAALDDSLHAVGGQDLERGALGRPRHRVRVLAHVKRAID
jgi:hypothetical protein